MIEISLLPVDEETKTKSAQKGLGFEVPKFISRGFGIAVVVLLALYALSRLRASSLSGKLTDSRHTLSELKKASREARTIEAKLGPLAAKTGNIVRPGAANEAPKDSGESLRKRANIFQTYLEHRKVWSGILREISLSCPEEIRLTEIKLSPLRTGTTSREAKELVISGFYSTGTNLEMIFRENLQKNKTIQAHYRIFIPMTQPQVDRTDFWIHCREQ